MPRKRSIPNVRERTNHWHIYFYSRRRSPNEVSFPFPRKLYSARDIQRKRDELYKAYYDGWDPWSKRLPNADDVPDVTITAAVGEYCNHKRTLGQRGLQGGWNERTFTNYRTTLMAFASTVGGSRLISSLTKDDLDTWIYQDRLAEATQRMYRRQLRTFLAWLKEKGYASLELPIAPVKRQVIPEFVTLDELEDIVAAHVDLCKHRAQKKYASGANSRLWMQDVFRFAFFQPQRQGEIASLTLQRVNLQSQQIRLGDRSFKTKASREQFVRVTEEAFPILESYYHETEREGRTRIFKTVGRMHGDAFRDAARLAFPDREALHYHSLRHSGAIHRLKNGWGIYDVSRLLTHASVKTTEKYLAALDNEERRRFGL